MLSDIYYRDLSAACVEPLDMTKNSHSKFLTAPVLQQARSNLAVKLPMWTQSNTSPLKCNKVSVWSTAQ